MLATTRIHIRPNWKHPLWAVGLAFALGLLIGAYLPTREGFGRGIEAVSAWLPRPESRPVLRRQLGPVKQRQLNRLREVSPRSGPELPACQEPVPTARPDETSGQGPGSDGPGAGDSL
jgi:hypothetical protein